MSSLIKEKTLAAKNISAYTTKRKSSSDRINYKKQFTNSNKANIWQTCICFSALIFAGVLIKFSITQYQTCDCNQKKDFFLMRKN